MCTPGETNTDLSWGYTLSTELSEGSGGIVQSRNNEAFGLVPSNVNWDINRWRNANINT